MRLCGECFFFFFKQKTAYEMRISDWSSDVCSSDLQGAVGIAVVIFIDVLRFEVDRRGGEAVDALHRELAGEMLGLVSRPAEPDAAALVQRRAHRDRKSALRPRRAAPFPHRHAVRDDDQPAPPPAPQPPPNHPAP